jgi:hypothetical protein
MYSFFILINNTTCVGVNREFSTIFRDLGDPRWYITIIIMFKEVTVSSRTDFQLNCSVNWILSHQSYFMTLHSTELTTSWLSGWWPFRTNPPVFSTRADIQLNCRANCLQDNSSAQTTQKTQTLYCCKGVFTRPLFSIGRGSDHIENNTVSIATVLLCASRFRGNFFTESLLRNRYDIPWFVSRSLPGNMSIRHNTLTNISYIYSIRIQMRNRTIENYKTCFEFDVK